MHVFLIKPSLYDDDGYVIRYQRGVLPSNTLACLAGLTERARKTAALGPDVDIEVHLLDEIVDRIRPERLVNSVPTGEAALFCLCGVQTNMFSRAADVARALRSWGSKVIIGGFHVSGIISVFEKPTPEMKELLDLGVSLAAGEVEDTWSEILSDAFHDRLEPFYNTLRTPPALTTEFLPSLSKSYLKKFAVQSFGTLDCGRGCPFQCSFCTVINVHGRTMRHREIRHLRAHFRRNSIHNGIRFYFFTDDNFARNRCWEAIFDMLIELRQEGIKVEFMMQIDTLAYRIPGFVQKAVRAGCTQVFIGMESLNPENLEAAGKRQNRVGDFREMIGIWRAGGVMTHVGYIIGFPYDTVESVRENVRTLANEVSVDLASFFVLTPLPGSADHRSLKESAAVMEEDLNAYDSFRPVTDHPRMTREDWSGAYWDAWRYFYSHQRMVSVLSRMRGRRLVDMLGSFLWYKYAVVVGRTHPMICGFHRRIDRLSRRSGLAVEGRFRFLVRRARDFALEAGRTGIVLTEFACLWLRFLPKILRPSIDRRPAEIP